MRKPGRPAPSLSIPHLVVVIVAAIVIPLVISGFVWAKKGVVVVVNGQSTYSTTRAETVSDVLDELQIEVAPGDVVSPLPNRLVHDGEEIVVLKATPVTLVCGGAPRELTVVGTTVADALVSAGLDPSSGLLVSPSVDTTLSSEMTITAAEVFVRVSREETTIPFATVEQEDPTLRAGQRRVVRQGAAGKAVCIYEVLVVADEETTRTVKAETVLAEPVDALVRVGTYVAAASSGGSSSGSGSAASAHTGADASAGPPSAGATMIVRATAYTPWDPGCGGLEVITRKIAAYGIPAGWGIVAVDPAIIPLGTRIYVPGYGNAVAADTGGGIKGARIDVCYWDGGSSVSRAAAIRWGVRTVTITIIE